VTVPDIGVGDGAIRLSFKGANEGCGSTGLALILELEPIAVAEAGAVVEASST
jgi:hypothetical protein